MYYSPKIRGMCRRAGVTIAKGGRMHNPQAALPVNFCPCCGNTSASGNVGEKRLYKKGALTQCQSPVLTQLFTAEYSAFMLDQLGEQGFLDGINGAFAV